MAKSSSKSTSLVPTRLERIAKKTGSISTNKASMSALPHDIVVTGLQATEVLGFLIAVSPEFVTLRHKKGHGSSKQIVSTFSASRIIERIGTAGESGRLTVLANIPILTLSGQTVDVKGHVVTATDIQTGEQTVLHTNIPGYTVNLTVDETTAAKKYGYEAAGKSGKSSKPAKAGKADKAAPAKGKKKKSNDEGF